MSSPRLALKDEDIISLRTAGDISVPREVSKTAHTHWPGGGSHYAFRSPTHAPRGGPTHTHWAEPIYQSGRCVATYAQPVYDNVRSAGVLATERAGQLRVGRREPEYHNVEALRAGGGRRGRRPLLRESGGDYASDVHSVTSRLSNVSVETNRSDPTDLRLSKYTVSHSSSRHVRTRSPAEQGEQSPGELGASGGGETDPYGSKPPLAWGSPAGGVKFNFILRNYPGDISRDYTRRARRDHAVCLSPFCPSDIKLRHRSWGTIFGVTRVQLSSVLIPHAAWPPWRWAGRGRGMQGIYIKGP